MSNSSLVNYTFISPNSSNPRNHKIDKITIHHVAGILSVETLGGIFSNPNRQASANYGVDNSGRIGMYVEESNRAWTSGNASNDNRAITIEVSNDEVGGNWHVSDTALETTINLCVDICQRNGIPSLNWTGNASGNLTVHNFFSPTACPGPYLMSKMPYIANEVNKRLNNGTVPSPSKPTPQPTPSTTKYKVGTRVCTNTLAGSSTGGAVYKGDWEGTITYIMEGRAYPYLLNNGTGWTNDQGIDSDPHFPGGSAPKPQPSVSNTIVKGSIVRPKSAVSYDGVNLIGSVVNNNYPVIDINGDRAVLGNGLNTAFRVSNLSLVSGGGSQSVPAPAPSMIRTGNRVIVTNPIDNNGTRLGVSGVYDVIEGQDVHYNYVVIGKGRAVTAAIPVSNVRLA